jgi:hypothetical protein
VPTLSDKTGKAEVQALGPSFKERSTQVLLRRSPNTSTLPYPQKLLVQIGLVEVDILEYLVE